MADATSILEAFAGYAKARIEDDASRPPLLGTIDPGYTSGSPRVTFDGESTMSTRLYPFVESYLPNAGDRVLLMPVGAGYVIVGAISTGGTSGVPAGSVQLYAAAAAPSGWLACDGSAVSRTTYSRLFAAIGTTWGAGNGSTTFNVPDLRGRVPVGAGTGSGLTARTLAETGGAETHTDVTAHVHTGTPHQHQGPSHTHTGPSHTHTAPDHMHQGPSHTHSFSGTTGSPDNVDMAFSVAENASVPDPAVIRVGIGPSAYMRTPYVSGDGITNHRHGFSGTTGSGGTGWTSSNGAAATSSGGTGATGASGTGWTSQDGTGYTGATGSASVDHMPPFRGMTYMIKA